MNKIFFGIHTSLLLLLCALLACCSQDEEEYAPTEKLVPLEFSAVIEGMGTRADATEKTAFVDGDEITITIDGDESGTEYKYKYSVNGENKKWVASDSEKQIMVKESADPIIIKATYGSVNLSGLNSYLSLDALANSLAATDTISYDSRNIKLEFTHTACKFVINVTGISGDWDFDVDVYDETIRSSYPALSGVFDNYPDYDVFEQPIFYIPTTANHIICRINSYLDEGISSHEYRINPSSLEAGKTYTCNIVVP